MSCRRKSVGAFAPSLAFSTIGQFLHWNGYSDSVGGVGGRAAWDGAILLHWVQFLWWLRYRWICQARTWRTLLSLSWQTCLGRRQGGMMILSLYTSLLDMCLRYWWVQVGGCAARPGCHQRVGGPCSHQRRWLFGHVPMSPSWWSVESRQL